MGSGFPRCPIRSKALGGLQVDSIPIFVHDAGQAVTPLGEVPAAPRADEAESHGDRPERTVTHRHALPTDAAADPTPGARLLPGHIPVAVNPCRHPAKHRNHSSLV